MALINCPECNREISDSAKVCPNCGFKLKKPKKECKKMNQKTKKIITIAACLVLVAVGISVGLCSAFSLSDSEKEQVISLNNLITEKMQTDIEGRSEEELTKCKEEYQNILEQYSKLQWKQQRRVNDYKAVKDRISDIDDKLAVIVQEKIQNVINLIDEVGEVTLKSKNTIDNIKLEYGKLDDSQKVKVTNYEKLSVFESKYDELCLQDTTSAIEKIGKVSLENDSKAQINYAESAYNNLSSELQKKVTNYNTLKKKKAEYNKLDKQKNLLLTAESKIKNGYLNEAKKTLSKLPSQFKYKNIKVSALKKQLESKKQWIALCGRWKTTSGQMRVTQVWDYDGRSQSWYRDFKGGEKIMDVYCLLKKMERLELR